MSLLLLRMSYMIMIILCLFCMTRLPNVCIICLNSRCFWSTGPVMMRGNCVSSVYIWSYPSSFLFNSQLFMKQKLTLSHMILWTSFLFRVFSFCVTTLCIGRWICKQWNRELRWTCWYQDQLPWPDPWYCQV